MVLPALGLILPAIIRMTLNSATGQPDLRNCSVDLLLMTLGLVRVTVKDKQGNGARGQLFIRTRKEDELEKGS